MEENNKPQAINSLPFPEMGGGESVKVSKNCEKAIEEMLETKVKFITILDSVLNHKIIKEIPSNELENVFIFLRNLSREKIIKDNEILLKKSREIISRISVEMFYRINKKGECKN